MENQEIIITHTKIINGIRTSFICPMELRDRLEQFVNDYAGEYTTEEIMYSLLDYALRKCGR